MAIEEVTRFMVLPGILSLVTLFGCSDAPEVPLVPTNRVVLVEFFTWQRCVYCPHAARALDSLVREFRDSVVVIAYHRRVAGDTLSPAYVEARRAFYYETGGEPATVFDGGGVVRTPGPEYNYETFRSYIRAARSAAPEVQLEMTVTLDSAEGTAVVLASGVDSTPTESLRLFIVITEDSLPATQSGAADTIFNSVMRAMLPDTNGRSIQLFRADTARIEERFALAGFWNRARLAAVAWVQEPGTKRVLQAVRCGIPGRRRGDR